MTFVLVDCPVSVLIGESFSLDLSGLRFSEAPHMKHCSLMLKQHVSSLLSLLGWDSACGVLEVDGCGVSLWYARFDLIAGISLKGS